MSKQELTILPIKKAMKQGVPGHFFLHRCKSGNVVSVTLGIPDFGCAIEGKFQWAKRPANEDDGREFLIWVGEISMELSRIAGRKIDVFPTNH